MDKDYEAFADLPAAEAALLWGMRVWVLGHCRQQDVSERIDSGWHDLGVDEALGFLEGFMWALSRGASRPIEVLCLCRREVSTDECTLLRAFCRLQGDEMDEAHALLCGMMSEQATTVALRSAEELAVRFEEAGMVLASQLPLDLPHRDTWRIGRVLH